MDWITPKTDWSAESKFDATDFNRIKNNLEYLHELAEKMCIDFSIVSQSDKTYADYLYAEDMNALEDNLIAVSMNTLNEQYYTPRTYMANEPMTKWGELNRLESVMLDVHERLTNQYYGRRMLQFKFGDKGGELGDIGGAI